MGFIESEYIVPTHKTGTARLEKIKDCVTAVSEKLEAAEKVAITSESWTALNTESYVTIICHYITDWKLQSAVLQTRATTDRHTAENCANLLNIATEVWDIKIKVVACIHDNAANVVLANTEFPDWE